ncbi:cytochrome c oxidase subunit 2, partial [Dissostichus eleginoides]
QLPAGLRRTVSVGHGCHVTADSRGTQTAWSLPRVFVKGHRLPGHYHVCVKGHRLPGHYHVCVKGHRLPGHYHVCVKGHRLPGHYH